jgi:hypothetical protein
MQVIKNYTKLKLVDYLKPGQKNLIVYNCGLGDTIMFLPYYKALCNMFPDIKFDLRADNQSVFFDDYDKSMESYDYVFHLHAIFNERLVMYSGFTKPECNCLFEMGIPYDKSLEYSYQLPHEKIDGFENVVGISFFNSCFPQYINCRYDVAFRIWDVLKENGFIPIHLFKPILKGADRNPLNKFYDFIDNTVDSSYDLRKMINAMSSMRGIAAVATGNFHYSMTVFPEKTLFLKKCFDKRFFTNKKVLCLDTTNPDYGVLSEWINRLK